MLETAVRETQQRDTSASADRVWSLLSSSGAWALRPGCLAFDVEASTGPHRLMFVIGPGADGVS